MPVDDEDLKRLRLVGDEEAEKALRGIWSKLCPEQQEKLVVILGRWDPSTQAAKDYLPAPVAAYVDEPFTDLPSWITDGWERITAAQRAFTATHSSGARVVLAAYSLPILYIEPEISFTLTTTAQLVLHARRRLEDTQGYVDAVMQPDSLLPGGVGQKWIRKVRLTHAVIRQARQEHLHPTAEFQMLHEAARPESAFQIQVFGAVADPMPLDQVELALVLQTFAWCMVEGLQEMGWPMRGDEPANHMLAWAAVGWMMGIKHELLPRTVEGGRELFERIREPLLAAGDPFPRDTGDRNDSRLAGRLLVAAWITILVQIQRERLPERYRDWLVNFPRLDEALQQAPRIFIRRLCGDRAARQLRIGHAGWFDRLVCWVALRLIDIREISVESRVTSPDVLSGALV
jgi:hypothetical protein